MGSEPYSYFVPYQADLQQALDDLREREFLAGRYNPAVPFPCELLDKDKPGPGAQHGSIEEALQAADGNDGTRSILDIFTIESQPDFGVAAPVNLYVLKKCYGTTQPTRQMIEQNPGDWMSVDRGHCVYVVLYKNGIPDELFFAGYSYD